MSLSLGQCLLRTNGEDGMLDLAYLALGIGCFTLLGFYALAANRL